MAQFAQLQLIIKPLEVISKRFSHLVLGAIIWSVGSALKLQTVRRVWWMDRDDSVIHLSSAKNLILFGSVGLSPGDRTEAMSSPLNFLISVPIFFINSSVSFHRYLMIYQFISFVVLGTIFAFYINKTVMMYSGHKAKIITNLGNFLLFVLVSSSWTTFGWLASGMENALVLGFLTLAAGTLIHPDGRYQFALFILSISLLSITRIELPLLLLLFYVVAYLRFKDVSRVKSMYFLIPFMFLVVFHLIRFSYYGQILPNTATALGKSLNLYPLSFFLCQLSFMLAIILKDQKKLILRRFSPTKLLGILFTGTGIITSYSLASNRQFQTYIQVTSIIFLGCIFFLIARLNKISVRLQVLFAVLLIPLNHFLIFGSARLSAFRIVSTFAPLIAVLAFELGFVFLVKKLKLQSVAIVFILVFTSMIFGFSKYDKPRDLCCSITPSEKIILRNVPSALSENGILPIVASPDLGKVTFDKKTINVDLGLIGDPLLARISTKSDGLLPTYLNFVASPDTVELHGYWRCVYSEWTNTGYFKESWKLTWKGEVSSEFNHPKMVNCPGDGIYTIWNRQIPQNELRFISQLSRSKRSSTAVLVKNEIAECTSEPGTIWRCEYVRRAIVRNIVQIRESGNLEGILISFKGSPTDALDRILVQKHHGWAQNAFIEFLRLNATSKL
jgi:hypothetical protein